MHLGDYAQGARYSFGGHETFPLRHGWLKKAVDFISQDPQGFSRDDAMISLGVGKNMVRAIKHWALACGILIESAVPDQPGRVYPTVSSLGTALFSDEGWDPFLEDTATLWAVHWGLVSNPMRALVWQQVFTSYEETEFDRSMLTRYLRARMQRLGVKVSDNVLEKEIDCLLKSYVVSPRDHGHEDDEAGCPLTELGLITVIGDAGRMRFNVGAKESLTAAVVGYSLIDYFQRRAVTQKSFTVNECLYGAGSPGQAFKLDEASLLDYLDQLEAITDGAIKVAEVAGNAQVFLLESLNSLEVLGIHYVHQLRG